MNATIVEPVRRTVTVGTSVERAFELFTGGFARWWPLDSHHIGEQPAETAVVEPRAGGRWFERAADGTECDWGRVLAWEPPHRLVLSWHLNADWAYDPDVSRASEIEVSFVEDGDATRVELEHRNLERHLRGDEIRLAISGDGGWSGLLQLFREAAER